MSVARCQHCSHDNRNWTPVDNGKVFTGNQDSDSVVYTIFATPVVARYLRVNPQTWFIYISMRCDAIISTCGMCRLLWLTVDGHATDMPP